MGVPAIAARDRDSCEPWHKKQRCDENGSFSPEFQAAHEKRLRREAERVEQAEWDASVRRIAETNSNAPRDRNGRCVRQVPLRKGQKALVQPPCSKIPVSVVLLEEHSLGVVISLGFPSAWPVPTVENTLLDAHHRDDAPQPAPAPPQASPEPLPAPSPAEPPPVRLQPPPEPKSPRRKRKPAFLEAVDTVFACAEEVGGIDRLIELASMMQAARAAFPATAVRNSTPRKGRARKTPYSR
jgi:hypothetical protein